MIWRHRTLLWRTTRSDVLSRYSGSAFGPVWLLLQPLLLLGAYAVLQFAMRERTAGDGAVEFVLLIFCGLIPFLGTADALSIGTTAVTSNSSLVKNTLFPIELVPVKAVLTAQATQGAGTVLLLLALAATGKASGWWLLLPLVWGLQVMFTIGLVWVLSGANVFLRDLQQMVGVLILVLMMVSPIGFAADSAAAVAMRTLLMVNPLSYVIGCFQDCLLLARFPIRGNLWVLAVLAPVMFLVGHAFFVRLKRVMTDNV